MAFEEDKQAAKDTLLAPTDKRVDMYRNCLIELKAALTNEQWNPNPYEIRLTVPAPGELDFLEEREAFRRAQFAAFLHILHTDDMGLWFKFPEMPEAGSERDVQADQGGESHGQQHRPRC